MLRSLSFALCGCIIGVTSPLLAQAKKATPAKKEIPPVNWVDPFIGTTNFGTTNPGAVLPHGMMSVSPFNVMGSETNKHDKDARWWSTPYEFHNKFFTGFSHVNLSGVGCPDLGSLLVMPTSGELQFDYKIYGSSYKQEKASPGYYSLELEKYGIKAEVSATRRSSIERYTFPAGAGNILLNLGEGLTNESGAMIRRISDTEIEGMKLMGTFAYQAQAVFPIYFVMRVSKKPSNSGFWKKQPRKVGVEAEWDQYDGEYKPYTKYHKEIAGDDIGYFFRYEHLRAGEQVEVQMGVSFVSTENARKNLNTEQQGFHFNKVQAAAREEWDKMLSRILVKGGTKEQKTIFYTALYHTLIHPNILNDVTGEYPAMESASIAKKPYDRYTVFSLWDTYRNLHQLLTLAYPEKQQAMVQTMVDMYEEQGWLPKWELYGRETYTMSGDPAVTVIVDSWLKGIRGFDENIAYAAMRKSATAPSASNPIRPENDVYEAKGYIPVGTYQADLSGDNSVSNALEYYMADYALSRFAQLLGHSGDASYFHQRALGYKKYYCPDFGTLRPIHADGNFYKDFNPKQGENFEHVVGFHEGSAWNYTFFVPHDIAGLVQLMGGEQQFVDKLQMVFDEKLYDPANEPDIAYPYLFSRIKGEEWRTQHEVSRLLREHFTTAPDGLPGNDDAGTMSAWAVFSMMGLYPDCPADPSYTLTSPVFDEVRIKQADGKDIIITSKRPSPDASYIHSIKLGDKSYPHYRLTHHQLLDKKKLHFDLQNNKPTQP